MLDPADASTRLAGARAVLLVGTAFVVAGCARLHAHTPPSLAAAMPMPSAGVGWDLVAGAARWVAYVGVLLAAGGAVFLAGIHDREPRERKGLSAVVIAAGIAAVVASTIAIPVQAVVLAGGYGATDGRVLLAVLDSPLGTSVIVRLTGLSLMLVGIARALPAGGGPLAVIGGGVAVISFILEGHSMTADPRWVAMLANACHGAAAALWFGGLVLLGLALRARRSNGDALRGADMVARFSLWMTAALPIVVLGGLALAWTELQPLSTVLTSAYGRTLAVKAVVVAVIAAVGAYNNRRLVPAIKRAAAGVPDGGGGERAWRRLGNTVRIECGGLLIVVAVTAVLVNVGPPRGNEQQTAVATRGGGAALVPPDASAEPHHRRGG